MPYLAHAPANPRTPRRRPRAAFTLLELLVVVGIIAVLAAMLIPTIKKASEQAKVVNCVSNLRQIAAATGVYTTQNDGRYPFNGVEAGEHRNGFPREPFVDVWKLLRPTITSGSFYICPADYEPAFTVWWMQENGPHGIAALDHPSSYYYFHPFYNRFVVTPGGSNDPGLDARQMFLKDVKYPARKAMFVCYGQRHGPLGDYRGSHGKDGFNLGFADGHASYTRFTDLNPTDARYPGNYDWTIGGLAGADLKQ